VRPGLLAVFVTASPAVAAAQSPPASPREQLAFECLPNSLAKGQTSGCQLLAHPEFARFGDVAVFWHLTRFNTRREAEAAKRPGDTLAEVAGRFWLTSLGRQGDTLTHGLRAAPIGPLPLPKADRYQMDLYHVIMPAHGQTRVHTHPGPEAWYVLQGEQCLEAALGQVRTGAGHSAIAPPGGTPMQLTTNGKSARQALFIVVHDPSMPMSSPSDWHPKGICDH
jgi:quercetin dioxygenase-like cupin family protein